MKWRQQWSSAHIVEVKKCHYTEKAVPVRRDICAETKHAHIRHFNQNIKIMLVIHPVRKRTWAWSGIFAGQGRGRRRADARQGR